MKIDPKVLQQLAPTYGVSPQSPAGLQKVLSLSEKAPANYEPILSGNGYEWSDEKNSYVLGDQKIYFFPPKKLFIWIWGDSLIRLLQGSEQLIKWVQGGDKYPEGKANSFMGIYKNMTGQSDAGGIATAEPDEDPDRSIGGGDIKFSGTGGRGEYEPKPIDPTDQLITKLTKQAGPGKRLPSDVMIDVGQKAKKENNAKLLAFLKTIRPMNENTIKRSQLNALVREIVKGVIKEGWQDDNEVLDLASQAWGDQNWRVQKSKSGEHGTVYQLSFNHPITRFLWKAKDGSWKALDPKTKKWNPVQSNVGEMTSTGAVSPVMTPNAFKKTKGAMEEVRDRQFDVVCPSCRSTNNHYVRDVDGKPEYRCISCGTHFIGPMEEGLEPLGGMEEGKKCRIKGCSGNVKEPAETRVGLGGLCAKHVASQTDREKQSGEHSKMINWIHTGKHELPEETLDEMTTTGDVSGYNIPAAFTKKGGSERGVQGSESLGYTLTSQGKKDMSRHADKMYQEGKK